jgi:CcmD family protein
VEPRNIAFMFYGLLTAWLIVALYVVSLARRGKRLKKELDDVKKLMQANEAGEQKHDTVRGLRS